MDRISFDIFIPDQKKFHLTPNTIVYGLWFFTCAIFWLLNDFVRSHNTFRLFFLLAVGAISLYYLITSFFKYEALNGTMQGKIIFDNDSIVINDETYELRNISKLDFGFSSYFGQMSTGLRGNFNGLLSQGVGNFVEFKNSSNELIHVCFRIQGKHGPMSLYSFINEAVKVGAMSYYRAIDLIDVENVTKPV